MAIKWPWSKPPANPLMKTQFWACSISSQERYDAFMFEDYDTFYSDENEEGDGPIPVSQFAGSQGRTSYDHDWMEVGPIGKSGDPKEAISGSYSEYWADEFMKRAADAGIAPNHFISFGFCADQSEWEYRKFPDPKSVEGDGFALTYLGEIEHEGYP